MRMNDNGFDEQTGSRRANDTSLPAKDLNPSAGHVSTASRRPEPDHILLRFLPSVIRNNLSDFIKYGVIGVFGTLLQTGTLLLYVEKGQGDPLVGSTLGFILSLLFSYFANSKWTFDKSPRSASVLVKYTVVSLAGLLLNLIILYLFERVLGWWYVYGQITSIIIVPIHNFILNKAWAFRTPNRERR